MPFPPTRHRIQHRALLRRSAFRCRCAAREWASAVDSRLGSRTGCRSRDRGVSGKECWGAIAKSNYAGLRFRSPVYRTLRELALSYFEHYYNLKGEKTLRAYSRPVNLARFDSMNWMTAEAPLWDIPEYLCTIKHTPVFNGALRRMQMDERLFKAGLLGSAE